MSNSSDALCVYAAIKNGILVYLLDAYPPFGTSQTLTTSKGTRNEVGMAGEFHVLAQLCQRGYSAHPTLGNTKGMDILVVDQESGKMLKVEVKTARDALRGSRVRPYWQWLVNSGVEKNASSNLFYCFVHLGGIGTLPRFFLVPSQDVASLCTKEHAEWVAKSPEDKRQKRMETTARNFWFYDDENDYEDNWDLLDRWLQDTTS